LPHESLRDLTWYTDWNSLPTNSFLISCEIGRKRITTISLHKTFDVRRAWSVKGLSDRVTYALAKGYRGFEYKLSRQDKRIMRAASNVLWKKAKGDRDGRIIPLVDAAPILLKHAQRT
jgi:hypothetical protein